MTALTVDKSESRVRKMFGEIAPSYDRMNHLLSMQADRYWRWRAVRILRPRAGDPILDCCTGTGDLALAFLRATKGQSEIIGGDFCRPMLDIADQKKAKQPHFDQLTFVEADSLNLPFEDDRFGIVSVAFGLRNVADTDQGLAEMTRVCRPGGKVAVLEFSMPTWQPMKLLYSLYFKHVLPRIGQLLARNNSAAYEYLPESVGQFPQGEELASKMRKTGLSSVRWHSFTFGIATLYIGEK
jgi:demethylmenaquinone methyltransferase/2-methoxy-6-polyprenyl-1,4-benzoquinol methylase